MAAYAENRPSVAHPQFAPPDERDTVEMLMARVLAFEQGIGQDLREKLNARYHQYRGFRRWRDDWVQAGPRDKDGLLYEGKQEWGAQLHIPLSYRTIETMTPAAISQRPRILILPRSDRYVENVANMRLLIDKQQDQIDIDLPFQAVHRSGRIYGLGVGKSFWKTEFANRRRMVLIDRRRGTFGPGGLERVKTFDDPCFEDVDVFTFGWDPYGSSMSGSNRARYAWQRLFLSNEDCMARISSGAWSTQSAQLMDAQTLDTMGSRAKFDEVWEQRMNASGLPSFTANRAGEPIHEIIEYHDGERVLTVLDRTVLVVDGENPCLGCMPFQVYRPTPLQYQMVGIGDLEPLEHLQRELDTLRSQRRDAATLALAAGYIFDEAMVDEEDLAFGPFAAIRVRNAGDIRAAIQPISRQEVPGSGYQEEQVIRQDFDLIPGINDAIQPGDGPNASTATEAQIVQAALSKRIELGSRRFEIEVGREAGRCFVYLNQRKITEQRTMMLPGQGLTYDQAAQMGEWEKVQLGPGELMGDFEFAIEGGSMAARNIPQDRQDAIQMLQYFGQNPYVDPSRPLLKALQLFGVENPQDWLKQAEPPVPPGMIDYLKRAIDPRLVDQAVVLAQRADPQIQQEGPGVQQVDQAMQGPVPA